MKKILFNLTKLALTVLILYLIFKKFQISWDDIKTALSQSRWEWILIAILTQIIAISFSIMRWRVLLLAQKLKVPFGHLTKTYLVGRFLGTFTPTGVGLEAYKAYDIARYTKKGAESVTVVFVEKFLTLLALSVLMLITLPTVKLNTMFIGVFFIFFFVILLILLILIFKASILDSIAKRLPFYGKTSGYIDKTVKSFERFKNTKGAMGTAIVYGVLVYLFLFSTYYANGVALRVGSPEEGQLYTTVLNKNIERNLSGLGIEYITQDKDENKVEIFLSLPEYHKLSSLGLELSPIKSDYTRKGLGLGDVLSVGPLTQIATMIPLSIAGIGLREGAFSGLLRSKGIWVGQRVVLTATMWYFVSVSVNIIGAIIFLTRRTDYETKITKEEFQRITT